MNRGDVHYIVITNNGQIERYESIKSLFRQDVKLIFKRTFLKKSSGQHLYDYYKNQILDKNFKVKKSNVFEWNNLKCKILNEDEKWAIFDEKEKFFSVCLELEIKDHLDKKKIYSIENSLGVPFQNMINILNIIDRVGSHQGHLEVSELSKELYKLNKKIEALKAKK